MHLEAISLCVGEGVLLLGEGVLLLGEGVLR